MGGVVRPTRRVAFIAINLLRISANAQVLRELQILCYQGNRAVSFFRKAGDSSPAELGNPHAPRGAWVSSSILPCLAGTHVLSGHIRRAGLY
jgi:hypothetical protein